MAKTETRKDHWEYCKANGLPMPEIVTPTTVVATDASGNKMLARDADVNENDVRDVYDDGTVGPWRRA